MQEIGAAYEKTAHVTVKSSFDSSSVLARQIEAGATVSAPSNPHLKIQWYYGLLLPKSSANATGEQFLDLYWVGGEYRFTEQFSVEAAFYNIDTYNRPEVKKAYWAQAYSLLADYQFTHSFDTYVGIMVMEFSGDGLTNHAPVNAYSSNGMYGVGLRYRF